MLQHEDRSHTMNVSLIALLCYSVFLTELGLFMSRRVKNSTDFFVAGRSLGPGRLFATFLAANIGAGSIVGATGLGYRLGMSAWWWVGLAGIGSLLLSQFLGPKLWTMAKQNKLATLQDFLEFRYNKAVKGIIAVLARSTGSPCRSAHCNRLHPQYRGRDSKVGRLSYRRHPCQPFRGIS